MFKRKYMKRAYKKRGFKRAAKPKARMTKPLRKAVEAVVNRNIETKEASYTGTFNPCSYTASNSAAGFIPLSPYSTTPGITITQGTGEGNRVGNLIKVVKATMKFVVTPTAYDLTANPFPLPQDLIIRGFTSKRSTNSLVTTVPNYFDLGSTAITPDGVLRDINRPVNKDLYTEYFCKKYKVGFSSFAPGSGTGANPAMGYYANNDYPLNVIATIDYTKFMPKIIRYNDTDGLPASRMLQTFIECVNADGSVQGSAWLPLYLTYTLTILYKDA